MIVGWRVATQMRTDMVLDAIEMARWNRGTRIDGLRCHSDAGSQFTSLRYGERLAEIGAVPSKGQAVQEPRPNEETTPTLPANPGPATARLTVGSG
jgi:transposase InsO family protein